MAHRNNGLCRNFASTGNCRFGDRCRFSHEREQTPSLPSTPRPSSSNRSLPVQSPARQNAAGGAPRSVCNFYWSSGSCTRGFECTYKHERSPQAAATSAEAPEAEEQEDGPDLFSVEGLATGNGSTRDERYTLTPSDAHNHLKAFLWDNFRFETAARVQGFVLILASVNDRNKAWNSENAQAFLDAIVRGNALLRIGDVLRFEPVDTAIGHGRGVLSFQNGYFPILEYLSSNLVLKTTMHKNINHLYSTLKNNYDVFRTVLHASIGKMVQAKSWKDPTVGLPPNLQNSLDGVMVFHTVSTVLYQLFSRFKDAVRDHPDIVQLVMDLATWFQSWAEDVSANPPRFMDPLSSSPLNVRKLTISRLDEEITRLKTIVQRESETAERLRRPATRAVLSPAQRREALYSQLAQTYDPPGSLRPGGARHDNDKDSIAGIRIAPTHGELLCPIAAYLPVFLPNAPHHLPASSMERHLDIQFRLLREELIATSRSSLAAIQADLDVMWRPRQRQQLPTKLEEILRTNGGAYRTTGYDSVFFQVYTGVEFSPVKAERRNLTVGLNLDTPNHRSAKDKDWKKRVEYWEHSKRLQSGTLVALLIISHGSCRIFLGVVSSFSGDIAESAKASTERIQIRISFFDAEVELMALRKEALSVAGNASRFALLVDNSVMFEASRPFLERLNTIEPTEIPFARYIAHSGSLNTVPLNPPRYAMRPGFTYKLDCLAKPGHGSRIQALDILRPGTNDIARRQLREHSILDPSQIDAVINTFNREVSLIQGPPGTGKSFTAKEILRVLFASKIRPIVLIAFTNHALDHMLTSVLDAKITTKLVRLGSRSSDERIAEYTLDKLEKVAGGTDLLSRPMKRQYAVMKQLEEQMQTVMESIQLPTLTWAKIEEYLMIHHPEHAERLESPPYWVAALTERLWTEEDVNGEWVTQKAKGKKIDDHLSRTLYGLWRNGTDIDFIKPFPVPVVQQGKKKGKRTQPVQNDSKIHDAEVVAFFQSLGFDALPPVPASSRTVSSLLDTASASVWNMSQDERTLLATEWERRIRELAYNSHLDRYNDLRDRYKEACQEYNDMKDETRRRLLSQTDLIGCTTTGAAKLTSLLSNISPRVLMVEEAGQVLEAHVLTSLVSSVHHLICIGDPQQLRPNLATYALSMDSERGKELFKFDRSMMERLADGGLPMSQINVQRRMRPEISHFIRTILYPKLDDNEVVQNYPHVSGMQRDVLFFTHTNKENGSDDSESVSKCNDFEVEMIRDLVLYLLRQGVYNGAGDIAVLCAYLGQLTKVRAALRDLKIAVSVDERDQEQLARQGLEEEAEYEEVLVAKHVRLGTVDIFQGQEAKVVIVSLVRNSGTYETGSASIGFLKSSNRINVALSRAKHGLYILGNAANLRSNKTWTTILDEMEARDQIGQGIPIVCPRHPDQVQVITKAGELGRLAPGGGCLIPCGFRLTCGHLCPSACHVAVDNHSKTRCMERCTRTPCPRRHPCTKRCSDDCGNCQFPIYGVKLPCGHIKDRVPCYMMETLASVKCEKFVRKQLLRCEHSATIQCFKDPGTVSCSKPCGGALSCCSKTCKSACSDCQKLALGASAVNPAAKIVRTQHKPHPCDRPLYCQHPCGLDCSQDHHCNSKCKQACRQECIHHKCPKSCSEPCAPCMEPCPWSCAHQSCPVACGSICSRLPCDEPCRNQLSCGHPCPSVCGEPCAKQTCIVCLPNYRRTDIVDFIMQRRLDQVDLSSSDTSERLITLACGHIFTVETLDGHCDMHSYYEIDPMGRFISTKAPPVNYQSPPTCPTCRGSITALRYGRVSKRATLDILEQNVASKMSNTLDKLSPVMERIASDLESMQESAKALRKADEMPDPEVLHARDAQGKSTEPLDPGLLNKGSMQSIHGFGEEEAKAWSETIKDIVLLYRRTVNVANTRGAHVKAYEAALTTLYHLEMAAIAVDPSRASDTPEQTAFEAVNMKIGQPPHKADTRFQIEAYLLSLELRFMLAQVASSRVQALPVTSDVAHRQRWVSFIDFILESCVADAGKALAMAQKSSASRQSARSSVYIIRSDFERFRAQIVEERAELARTGDLTAARRQTLALKVKAKSSEMLNAIARYEGEYIRSRPSKIMQDLRDEREWFKDNCGRKVERWREECTELEKVMLRDKFYQPLSLQERADIVKAFGFTHRGHFYNCENGHTFVITECGGAMQNSFCPECRAPIGGMGHHLNSANTRAREFEDVARVQGVLDGAFPWTRDA